MTRVTQPQELSQFDKNKYTYKKTAEDKAYQTFLNSIFDEDGILHHIGGHEIPETVVEVCRVYNPEDEKEYLVYDVNQYGFFEDGTKSPLVHLQDIGVWREYEWVKRPEPTPVFTGEPQKRSFKFFPQSYKLKYDIEFTWENVDKIRKKSTPSTRLYVYDLGKSGKGGKDGKIGVDNWEDFRGRPFRELIEGTYLLQTQLQNQFKALKEKENYLNAREQLLQTNEVQAKTNKDAKK